MLLVYTQKVTPRLIYTAKQIFTRILQIPVGFTNKVEEFIAHDGLKLSYGKQPLGNEFFIRSIDLLFHQGIDFIEVQVGEWEDVPVLFQVNSPSPVPFDIFAATFYMISRYEEYLPHVKDEFERFPAEESLAYEHGFLDRPVVDIWAYKLRDLLREKYPDYAFKSRAFRFLSTVDIDIAYKYKYKGFIRTLGGAVRDLLDLNFQNLLERFLVQFNFRKDPFDVYDQIMAAHKKHEVDSIFFFLLGNYSHFDKNVSPDNLNYRMLIKDIADYMKVGLHPSYYTMKDDALLKKEKKRMENIVNFPVTKSRQHFLRVELPETYQILADLEIREDYTMGFASHYGFRAGTCTPFYFYDLDYEIQTPVKVFPFAVMDGTLKDYLGMSTKKSFDVIDKLAAEVKAVDGYMITLFHNESISGTGRWRGWDNRYYEMIKKYHTPPAD